MAGVRLTREISPTELDNDQNGFVLAFSPRTRPSNLNSRGLSGNGWARVRATLVANDPRIYKYWVPLRDLKLLPMHEETEAVCETETT